MEFYDLGANTYHDRKTSETVSKEVNSANTIQYIIHLT